jgi:hypothetical protein
MVDLLNWRERMTEDMTLRDFRPRTHEGYLLATRQFIDHFGREPDSLTEEDAPAPLLEARAPRLPHEVSLRRRGWQRAHA